MHPFDRYFYDRGSGSSSTTTTNSSSTTARNYTVDRYLDDANARYGGLDAALVWPSYPNLGVDDRNQFDMFRALPGGLGGVARFVAALRARGVSVLFPYLAWDGDAP